MHDQPPLDLIQMAGWFIQNTFHPTTKKNYIAKNVLKIDTGRLRVNSMSR